eukprot:RCo014371
MGERFSRVLPPPNASEESLADAGPVFIGTVDYIVDDSVLAQLHIRAIVSCLPHAPDGIQEVLHRNDIRDEDYMLFPLEDNSDYYLSMFDGAGVLAAVDFIHARRLEMKAVLVHCDAGRSRSPSVVIAYLMKYGLDVSSPGMSLVSAHEYVSSMRPNVNVTLFRSDLRRFEQLLFGDAVPSHEGPPASEQVGRQTSRRSSRSSSFLRCTPSGPLYSALPASP